MLLLSVSVGIFNTARLIDSGVGCMYIGSDVSSVIWYVSGRSGKVLFRSIAVGAMVVGAVWEGVVVVDVILLWWLLR